MATTTRRAPCGQCKRRRQRLRARSPFINALCSPVSRWTFTLLAIAGFHEHLTTPALVATGIAALAWRYR